MGHALIIINALTSKRDGLKNMLRAIILDLDGVVVTTDALHARAWKAMADHEGLPFDDSISEKLRGVSRMECVDIILGQRKNEYDNSWKRTIAEFKNHYYVQLLGGLTPKDILPRILQLMAEAKAEKILLAIGSSSKNAKTILTKIGLLDAFDAIVDGNDISRSKPDPEVFLKAAEKMGIPPASCVVIEDADAGIDAALAAGMKAFAVGYAANYGKAHGKAVDLANITLDDLKMLWNMN